MRNIPEPVTAPRRLRPGSRVALIAPAGPVDEKRILNATAVCASLDLEPVFGRNASARNGYLAGSDDQRASDFHDAVEDDTIDAIWALRGGYGTARIVSRVDLEALKSSPRAFIGFSDNTTLHLALARLGLISFHAPHAGGEFPPFAEHWFRRMLFDGSPVELTTPDDAPLACWHDGVAEGRLVGGNLSVIAASEGTRSSIPSDGAILFLEDVGEPPYRIDRLVTQLANSGALDQIAGVIIGQFTDCDAPPVSGLDTLRGMLANRGVPVVANAPVGHVADNWTLPVGARVRLDAASLRISLLEPVTSA